MASDSSGSPDSEVVEGHRTVTDSAVHAFASLTGDYARMHLDHAYARRLHGGPPIAHGLLSASWALGVLTRSPWDPLLIHDPRAGVVAFQIRLRKSVSIGDTLALRWKPAQARRGSSLPQVDEHYARVSFEVLNQAEEVTGLGEVTLAYDEAQALKQKAPEPWSEEEWKCPDAPSVFYAEDLLDMGPRGETQGQTLTEVDRVNFAREVGELNPRALNAAFAAQTPAGELQASPMLIFCLGFSEFLQALLTVPLPDTGFAGHVGDSWRVYRRVCAGDTLVCRHRPLSCTPSKSRPDLAIVEFGLQFLNQRGEVVQDGVVVMMIPTRDPSMS
ncbi:MAG: MaoC/PaaZ C-terminal domain-containing protein [Myxococcota bacterium]|nr:MaoC/PaaZ C-terminal domain-containing protein [Myxococcota bacterium]